MKDILFVGDCHGKTMKLNNICQKNPDKIIFQLGDMGLGFKGVHVANIPNLVFIRGNHDDPDACRKHPAYAGEFGTFEDVFFISGAFSIDYQWRIPGVSWWDQEQLSERQLDQAIELYKQVKPRFVCSHEAPADIVTSILGKGFRPEKIDCAHSVTSIAMQRMLDIHRPEHWYFGHYHTDWFYAYGINDKETQFHCLDELSTRMIDR